MLGAKRGPQAPVGHPIISAWHVASAGMSTAESGHADNALDMTTLAETVFPTGSLTPAQPIWPLTLHTWQVAF